MQTGFNQTVIDGYSGFIFQNRNGGMRKPTEINRVINKIIADYNAEETDQAKKESENLFCSRIFLSII